MRTTRESMKSESSETLYPVQQEKIGKPDPLALGYVGTYSPPSDYRTAAIDKPSALDVTL